MFAVDFKNPLHELTKNDLYVSLEEALEERYENINEIISGNELKKERKSSESLRKEFNLDKWGTLNKILKENKHFELEDIERIEDGKIKMHFFKDDQHFKVNPEFFRNYLKFLNLETIIKMFNLCDFNKIVEIGCGYGSKLLEIPKSIKELNNFHLIGLDISDNGLEIANYFAAKYNFNLTTHKFNFRKENIKKLKLKNSLLLSNYALHYHKSFTLSNIKDFIASGIVAGIHFEPCPKLISTLRNKNYAKLCVKYIQHNDYTSNISDAFMDAKKTNIINLQISEKIYGNGLLPGSLITWQKI